MPADPRLSRLRPPQRGSRGASSATWLTALLGWLFATGVVAADLRPWSGGPAPALVLPVLAGGKFDLAEQKGKVVVLNFWATWCAPCIKEMPSLEKLAKTLGSEKLVVVAVNYGETEERIGTFLKKIPISLPVVLDRDLAAARSWGAKVLPTSFVVGRDGRIAYSVIGDLDWAGADVFRAMSELAAR